MTVQPFASYTKSERLFALYQCLPRDKDKAISLTELMSLYGKNPDVYHNERKNLENDLTSLNRILNDIFYSDALVRVPNWYQNISGKTARFYLKPNFSIDIISEQSLFFWEMLNNYTANYLPVEVQQNITEKLTQIRKQDKAKFYNSPLGQWRDHLLTLPSVTLAPTFDNEVLNHVHQALLTSSQLLIRYSKRWSQTAIERVIYPKGLVFIDNMIYLTGFNPAADNIDDNQLLKSHRNFAVCRITTATVLDDKIPDWLNRDTFTLDNLQKLGKLEKTATAQIKLILQVERYACQHLYERPLAADQQITAIDETWHQVTASVANTQRLQDWLVSMSQQAVVIEPEPLRLAILQRLKVGVHLYSE